MTNDLLDKLIKKINFEHANNFELAVAKEYSFVPINVQGDSFFVAVSPDADKEKIIEVEDHSGAYEVGEQVTVWGQTSLGMQAVLLAFVVPLFIILVALIVGTELRWSETATGLSGLLLLVPYYYIMYRMRGRLKKRFVFRLAKI